MAEGESYLNSSLNIQQHLITAGTCSVRDPSSHDYGPQQSLLSWLPISTRGRYNQHEAMSQIKLTVSKTIATLSLLKNFPVLVISLFLGCFNEARSSNRRNCIDV